MPDFSVY